MNDFTKDELKLLKGGLSLWMEEIFPIDEKDGDFQRNLFTKIKSMIDSYCEHEWENICCQCTLDKIYCHKCEKDMGDLKERYDG